MKLVTLDGKMNQDEIIVDNFAGGGGASTGIELAIGRSVDVAINHDPDAIAIEYYNFQRIKSKLKCSPVKYRESYRFQSA